MMGRPENTRWEPLALGGWTLLVWVGRVRNVLADDLVGWPRAWRLGVALLFVGLGAALVLGSLSRRAWAQPVGAVLALFGSAWWLIRGTGILLADHPIGFKMVHTALAIVTVALSWLVLRAGGWSRSLAPGRADRYHPPRYG